MPTRILDDDRRWIALTFPLVLGRWQETPTDDELTEEWSMHVMAELQCEF